jgi:dihydroorotate dehydrogenase (NAD+) catalytic subunit
MIDRPAFLKLKIKNRSVLASGILGVTISSLRNVYVRGAGIVTTKSIGPEKRKGHPAPVVYEWEGGLINAVGLSNPGIDVFISTYKENPVDFPVIVSVFGKSVSDYIEIAEKLEPLNFNFLELNISCPNVQDEFGTPFGFSPNFTRDITEGVKKKTEKPVIVKLSPNTPNMVRIAVTAQESGADAVCIANTAGPGMVIDTNTAVPVLANKAGGVSGPAVLPLTVKNVYNAYKELSIPIIGTGGVSDTDGALQVLMAGASLYGIGSAVHSRGLDIFKEIEKGVLEFAEGNGFESTEDIIGLAHKSRENIYYRTPGIIKNQIFIKDQIKEKDDKARGSGGKRFRVATVKEIMRFDKGSVRTLFFDSDGFSRPEPGQFFMLWVPGSDQKPCSVSYYDGVEIGFSLMKRGKFSESVFNLKEGEPVGLLGPLGNGFSLERFSSYLLAGGGIGTAPLIFTAARLVLAQKKVCIIAGGKNKGSLEWVPPLIEKLKIGSETELLYCTEDCSFGEPGVVTDHLQKMIEKSSPEHALICGPEHFIKNAISIFNKINLKGQASIERMMKCGIGLCGSCCIDPTGDRVCVEGPVFEFDYLDNLKEFGSYKRDESGTVQNLD